MGAPTRTSPNTVANKKNVRGCRTCKNERARRKRREARERAVAAGVGDAPHRVVDAAPTAW